MTSRPSPRHRRPGLAIAFVPLRSFTLTPLSTFIDALRLAADESDMSRPIRCSWSVLGSTLRPVPSSCGIAVAPDERFGDPRRFDYIVVVGGLLHRGPQADEATLRFIRDAADAGVTLIGLCTAGFTLVRAGVMQGRRCCVSWFHHDDFVRAFPEVRPVADQLFVVDDGRITCAGGAGALDVAAWVIERHLGRAVAQKCLHILVVDHARPPGAAQPQPPALGPVRDARVRRAALLIEQSLAAPLRIAALARRLGLSTRQLERLFHAETGATPAAFARRVRLDHGRHLLAHSDKPVVAIAEECGFVDASHFAREFRRAFGTSPSRARSVITQTVSLE